VAYSAMVGGDSLVAGLLPPPDDSAVTPPLSAHHMVAMHKLTEDERQSPLEGIDLVTVELISQFA